MATINKFEDLEIWKRARIICKDIYSLSGKPDFYINKSLKDQILRSSGSIMDNIAEGFEREGNKEFIHFSSIAKASCGECRSQIYRALDQNNITQTEFDKMHDLLILESKQINTFMQYIKHSNIKGNKFN